MAKLSKKAARDIASLINAVVIYTKDLAEAAAFRNAAVDDEERRRAVEQHDRAHYRLSLAEVELDREYGIALPSVSISYAFVDRYERRAA